MRKRFAIYSRATGDLLEGGFFSRTMAWDYAMRTWPWLTVDVRVQK